MYFSRTQIKPRGVVCVEQTNSSIPRAGVHTARAVLWPNVAQLTVRNHHRLLDTILHTLDLRCVGGFSDVVLISSCVCL